MLLHGLPPADPNACCLLQSLHLHEACKHCLQAGDMPEALVMQALCDGSLNRASIHVLMNPAELVWANHREAQGFVKSSLLPEEASVRSLLQAIYQSLSSVQLILPPITRPREVDFGPPIRKATCYLYNLPEVESTFETMRVPTVSARFSTAPFFWNWAMIAVARLAPRGFLEDRAKCASPATASEMLLHAIECSCRSRASAGMQRTTA